VSKQLLPLLRTVTNTTI